MVKIGVIGDKFMSSRLFVNEIRGTVGADSDVTYTEWNTEWPEVPFGPVGNVLEASGTPADTVRVMAGCDIAVTQMAPFTDEVFEKCPELRLVCISRGGPVNVDIDAAVRHGVVVTNTPGRNAEGAAEYAVGMILAALRRVTVADAEMKSGRWRGDYYAYENAGSELKGTVVGLVGCGAVGRIVGRLLLAFGAQVAVYDPFADQDDLLRRGMSPVATLSELMSSSRVVSLHARLTKETFHLVGERELRLLPRGAVLVNMARGGLLDYAPLPELLGSGALGAVALDVYDEEPPSPSWPLFAAPNVLTTPHLAGATKETAHHAAAMVAENVRKFLMDMPLDFVVGARP